MFLPLANLLHHKLRGALSALGIGIGICMLVTLSGLSRGSLYEVSDRWQAVEAELFVYPEIWGENVSSLSGVGVSDRYADILADEHGEMVRRIVPVFLWQIRLGGQGQLAAGVDADDWRMLVGDRALAGRVFDPQGRFADWIEGKLLTAPEEDAGELLEMTEADLAAHGGLELVIDSRLAEAAGLGVGRQVEAAGHEFTIVGVVEAGGLSRVYLPRRTAQYLFGSGDISKSTLLFVDLREGVAPADAARKLRRPGLAVVQTEQFRHMLERQFGVMFVYVDAVNVVALVIAFLFIMITLYTMVLQRTREIAILRSSGASGAFLVRQILWESLLLTTAGAAAGVALALAAGWAIELAWPLLTVRITPATVAAAAGAALVGAAVSALYPAWRAARIDMVEALAWE